MSERSKHLTIVVSELTQDEASALIGHSKMCAASWSHAIHDRDAKDAEIAELRAKLAASEASDAESIAMFRKSRDERDEARECAGRLYSAAIDVVAVADRATLIFDTMKAALYATPEHLRK